MLPPVDGSTQQYLNDLGRTQSRLDAVQRQVSSGIRVGVPSDDPSAIPSILEAEVEIAIYAQSQAGLNQVASELQISDSALQQALQLVEQAISLGSQGASMGTGASRFDALAAQAGDIQQALIGLTATSDGSRYVFSGDLDQQPLYALDPTQPAGVRQLAAAKSTRLVVDAAGNALWTPRTAAEIFDARNPDGSCATDNVFAAVNGLVLALQNRDGGAVQNAIAALKSAHDRLDQESAVYGIGETRVSEALNAAAQFAARSKQELSAARDTDLPAAAAELSQLTLQQQAALSARARISQLSLFDYLG